MKFSIRTLMLTSALQAFCTAIKPSIGLSLQEGNQNILKDDDKSVPGQNPLRYCYEDYSKDLFQLDYINLDPELPKKGQTLLIEAAGQLLEETKQGAYIQLKVAYGLINLINTQADLCDQISNVNLTCPLKKGPVTIKKEVKLPSEIPSGKYMVSADAYTVDDDRLLCLTSEIRF